MKRMSFFEWWSLRRGFSSKQISSSALQDAGVPETDAIRCLRILARFVWEGGDMTLLLHQNIFERKDSCFTKNPISLFDQKQQKLRCLVKTNGVTPVTHLIDIAARCIITRASGTHCRIGSGHKSTSGTNVWCSITHNSNWYREKSALLHCSVWCTKRFFFEKSYHSCLLYKTECLPN